MFIRFHFKGARQLFGKRPKHEVDCPDGTARTNSPSAGTRKSLTTHLESMEKFASSDDRITRVERSEKIGCARSVDRGDSGEGVGAREIYPSV